MAISYVATSAFVTGANPTVAVPTGYAEKDLLVIVTTGTATPTTPTGWTSRAAQAATGFITILYKFATGTEASVALTLAGSTSTAVMVAYRGVSATDTITAFTTGGGGATSGTLTTTYANEFIVYACSSAAGAATTWTLGPGTSRGNTPSAVANNGLLIADEQQTAAGLSTARTSQTSGLQTVSMVGFSIIPSGRYWVGGTGTWTTTTTNWSFSSGGASGAPAPTANDPVTFDQAATYTVTMTGALTCFGMTVSAGTVTFATGTTPTLTNSGSMSLVAGTVWTNTGLLTFNSTSTGRTVTTNAVTINSPITFDGVGGNWSLGSALSTGVTLTTTLNNGTLTLNGFDLSTGIFSSSVATARTIAFGTNFINLVHTTAATTVLNMATVTLFTWSGTGGFKADASITRTFTVGTTGGSTTTAPNLSITTSAAIPTITTASWINNLDFTGGTNTPAITTVNLTGSLTLATGGTYTNLSINAVGTGTVTPNGKSIAALVVNTAGTTTLAANLSVTTYTQTLGTFNFATFNLTCSGAASFAAGTLNNIGTISCTTWAETGTFTLSSGTISASTSFTVTSGSFTYSGGTITTPSFVHTAGTVTTTVAWTMTTNSTYTFTAGTLTLGGNLTTGIFSSAIAGVRAIAFSTFNIVLAHTTAATTVLNMPVATTFTYTGTGGFTADAAITRTYVFGTTGGTSAIAPNLSITSGVSIPTITTGSWFNLLNFTGSSTTPAASVVNVNAVTLSTGGTYTSLGITMVGTGTITNNGKTIAAFAVNNGAGTATLSAALSCTTYTQTAGAINFATNNLTCSGAAILTTGTLTNVGTITCTTATVNGTFTLTNGTITPSAGFVVTTGGAFTYSGGTINTTSFTHTAGTVTVSQPLTLSGSYTLTAGTLTLASNLTSTTFITTGTGTRAIQFSTNQIILTGNNTTIWDGGGTGITYTGTPTIVSNYAGSVGTRTINVGTGWTEVTAFDVKAGAAAGISIGTSGTDIVAISGNIKVFDLTGMLFTYTSGTMSIYGNYTIPATGGSISTSASITTFASTNATARVLTVDRTINFPIQFTGIGGTFNLGSNLTVGLTSSVSLNIGTLVLNGYNLTTGFFASNNSNSRSIQFGSNSITVNGQAGTIYDFTTITNFTVTGTPTINVTSTTGTIAVIPGPFTEANAFNFNISATPTGVFSIFTVAGNTAKNVDFTGFTGTIAATLAATIYGNYTLSSGTTVTASTNTMTFGATSGTKTITTNGKTMPPIAINGIGGTFNLGGNLTSSGLVQVLAGTLNTTTSNYTLTCTQLDSSTTTNNRVISLNNSTVTITDSAGITLNSTNLTFNAGTSQINLTASGFSGASVISAIGGVTFYNVTSGYTSIDAGTGNRTTTITFNDFYFTNSVQLFCGIAVNGTLRNDPQLGSYRTTFYYNSPNTVQVTVSAANVVLYNVNFQNINAAGAAIPFTGAYLGDLGNNTNITFPAGKTVYWNKLIGGDWRDDDCWALTPGGTININNFPLPQDTAVIQNTGLNTGATIDLITSFIGTLDMSGRTNAMTLRVLDINIIGNWINGSGVTITAIINPTILSFVNASPVICTITSAGKTFPTGVNIEVSGNLTLKLLDSLATATTGEYVNLQQGTLDLNGFDITTSSFNSTLAVGFTTAVRNILFGSNFINLVYSTAASLNLNCTNSSGFTATGAGGLKANMSITRSFAFAVGSTAPPNLFINAGASIPTFTIESAFTTVDFTGSTCTPAVATLNVNNLVLATGGTYTNLTVKTRGTGTITGSGKTLVLLSCLVGTTTLSGTLTAPLTVNVGTFSLPAGAILNSATVTLTAGTINLDGGTLPATTAFTHTAGTSNVNAATSLAATGVYTLTAGTLNLNAYLTVGTFVSNNANVRTINFNYNNIILATTTAAAVNLDITNATNFSYTGYAGFNSGAGGFYATMSTTRTFTVGTTGGTSANAPSLYLVSGASVPTLTTGSWFNEVNFGTTTSTIVATTVNVNNLYLSSTGTYTALAPNIVGLGSIQTQGKTLGAVGFVGSWSGCPSFVDTLTCTTVTVNGPTFDFTAGTINPTTSVTITTGTFIYDGGTLAAVTTFTQNGGTARFNYNYTMNVSVAACTYTFNAGTLTIYDGVTMSTGIFSSSNASTRTINFGVNTPGYIGCDLSAGANATVLNMAIVTGLTINAIQSAWGTSTPTATYSGGFTANSVEASGTFTSTYVFGTTGGTATNAPNLQIGGPRPATITTGSWFNELNTITWARSGLLSLGTTSLNVNGFAANGSNNVTYTGVTLTFRGTGNVLCGGQSQPVTLASAVFNTTGTVTLYDVLQASTITITSGILYCYYWTNGPFAGYGGLSATTTITQTGGSWLNNAIYILASNGTSAGCTTYTINGASITFTSGTIFASTNITLTSGSFTAAGGIMSSTPAFTHTAGTVTVSTSTALTTTSTYTFTAGTLTISDGQVLSVGIFSSANANARTINFGSQFGSGGSIQLTHTTAATTVLSMATLTGFVWTGLGGFTVADMANTRTFSVGNTAGGSLTTAPNLSFTTGASVGTITTGSWFNNLYLGDTTFNIGTTALNIGGNLTLGQGTYTALSISMLGTGYLWNRYNDVPYSMGPLTINTTGTIALYPGYTFYCTTVTFTAGTFNLDGAAMTCSSTFAYNGGTFTLGSGTLICTTFTQNGPTLTLSSGNLLPTVGYVLAAGTLTYSGTANLNDGALPAFTQTTGTVNLNKTFAMLGTSTYTLTAGTLTLAEGVTLSTGIFSSNNANTRAINFGTTRYTPSYYDYPNGGSNTVPPTYIYLTHSTAATTILNMATATGFTWTGSGLFYYAAAATATVVFGTTGGSTTNAPNLYIAANTLTVTTGSWFNVFNAINYSGQTMATTSINVSEAFLIYPNGSDFSLVTVVPQLSTTLIRNNTATFGGLTINVATINLQLYENLTLTGALTLLQGTLTMGLWNVTSGTFASTGTLTRSMLGNGSTSYTVTGAGATAFSNASGTGLTMANFSIYMTSSSPKTFAGGGGTFPRLVQTDTTGTGAGILTITGANTFYDLYASNLPATILFTAATITTFRNFSLAGAAGTLVTIASSTAATHTLSITSGVVIAPYMSITNSIATGGKWFAPNSTNGGGDTGWIFSYPTNFFNLDNISFNTAGGGITFSS